MQEGAYAAKGATIISEKNDEIAAKILSEMERGATFLKLLDRIQKWNVTYCIALLLKMKS